jgi:hemerythrin
VTDSRCTPLRDSRLPARSALLHWSRAYECGQPGIDRQHRELFELGNEVLAAADARTLERALGALFLQLAQHFADEEALLATLDYEPLAAHRLEHRRLLARARALELRAAEGRASPGELAEFLALDVVEHHLLQRDREYFTLLSGRAPAAKSAQSSPSSAGSSGLPARALSSPSIEPFQPNRSRRRR